ncbi:hypothetical protein [Clostridium beijerinckii]|uniref:hypothetical protein n=1 Tax=Clostridium beijerinckii TaxID=1520 RepID=UPI0014948734|nr:hypothetical protein [Clostridium beijerinckii]NOW03250.1 hypothetical protein [Clostridium beijerinckii]NYC03608.1 hypothetical protein [Clostridium beijerinckii]
MDFNIGNLSSCVMGAVVQLATTALSLVEETASAVLGAIAGLTNVTEDGEVDEDELEGFLNNLSKVVVGAIIATLGSRSAGIKNYDEEDSEEDDSEEVAVDGNELDNYLYDYIWVFGRKIQTGKKLYSASQLSDLPKEIRWEVGGYVYYYTLQEQPFSEGVFGGEPVYGQEITLNDGKVINTKVYGYVLTYTNAPPQPEIKDGTLPFVPGVGMFREAEGSTVTSENIGSGKSSDFIKNKYPNEAIPSDGKIIDYTLKDGKIKNIQGLRRMDFVIDKSGKLIIGKKHQALGNADDVLAAGQIKVDGDGMITRIDNSSGHYRPTVEEASKYPELFEKAGLNLDKAWLEISDFELDSHGNVIGSKNIVHKKIK